MKKKILILNGQYLPGYKGGGPIQSCVNMIENLSDKYTFYVLCADRDFKTEESYENIKINDWNQVGSAEVFYMSPDTQTLKGFRKILNSIDYDILYLNGFFSPIFTIKPLILRRLGVLKNTKIILTPRGDFTGGCENKKLKKYSYIYLTKIIGLYNNLLWHATSDLEEKDIKYKFRKAKTFVVSNLPAKYLLQQEFMQKNENELRLIFISRIFPKKNLKYALEVLKEINSGNIVFDIYGPMEDKDYWEECKTVIKEIPHNINVNYCGEVPHSEICNIFKKYHAFFFPTLGENYGHVIVEAMMNNCLVILSREVTPWDKYSDLLDLGAKLNEKQKFVDIIQRLLKMNNNEMAKVIDKNIEFIASNTASDAILDEYQRMLG